MKCMVVVKRLFVSGSLGRFVSSGQSPAEAKCNIGFRPAMVVRVSEEERNPSLRVRHREILPVLN